MERTQINAPAAKLRGTVAVLKIYREDMDVIKEREKKEPWMIKEREDMDVIKEGEGKRTMDDKGGSERKSHSPITAVE